MRIIFMGTPEFGVPTFERLLRDGHEIVACYTQPPRPAGRGKQDRKTPVHLAAQEANVPVFYPQSLKSETEQTLFASHNADLAIVVAYGLLLPKPVLDAPRYGCLNLHGSALPRWRGAAPIQRAIMAGDTHTAIQVMAMETGLDTGAVCASTPIEITPGMTAGDLHDKMVGLGATLMSETLENLEQGNLRFTPQDEQGVIYAKKIKKSEAAIDWHLPAEQLLAYIHGLSPFPGAWSNFSIKGKPVRVKILRAQLVDASGRPGEILNNDLTIACSKGAIKPVQVQRAGKAPMSVAEFMRGAGDLTGQQLESL